MFLRKINGEIMKRTVMETDNNDTEKNMALIDAYLKKCDYELITENDETFYINTLLDADQCIKPTFDGNKLVLEGWLRMYPFRPFFNKVKESDLSGINGIAIKRLCKKAMKTIIENTI